MTASPRRGATGPRRLEYALHALVFGAVGLVARTHFAGLPERVLWVRILLALGILWFLYGLVRGRPPVGTGWRGWTVRLLWWAPVATGLVLCAMSAGLTLALFVVSKPVLMVGAGMLPVTWVGGLGLAWYGRIPWSAARLYVTVSGFLFLLAKPIVSHVAWAPPSAERCRAVAEHPHVSRLTDQALVDGLSQPYELHWIAERDLLVGTLKMAGNATLPYWNVPEANEVVFFDLRDPEAPERFSYDPSGRSMPQYMASTPEADRLAVNYFGFGEDRLEVLDIGDLDRIRMQNQRALPGPPNDMVALPGSELLALFWFRRPVVDLVRWDDLGTARRVRFGRIEDVYTMYATFEDATKKAYASLANGPVVELEFQRSGKDAPGWTRDVRERLSDSPPGMGTLAVSSELGLIARTRLLERGVELIDTETLEPSEELSVGYRTRPVALDARRRLLLVGEWLDGRVHLYHLDRGWRPTTIPTGPYLRTMAYAPESSQLYVGSKCGIYRIDLGAHLASRADAD